MAGSCSSSGAIWAILCVVILGLSLSAPVAANERLKVGFYERSCPNVEKIVYKSMVESFRRDKTVAPGVLRIAFHDCFVRGCDASLLLTGPNTERESFFNAGVHGFEAVDAAKKAVEKACPGIVSASDVLQFAARDSVILTGGYGWAVPAGRRDGKVSIKEEATEINLPTPLMKAPELIAIFKRKGMNAAQMVILSGAHTIGKSPCVGVDDRLHASPVDPTLPADFAASLRKQCPRPGLFARVDMDSTSGKFDTQYFKDIIRGRGLLTSDQALLEDSRTRGDVYTNSGAAFYRKFGEAMVAMSRVGVLTGKSGEIRRQIGEVNKY